MKILSFVAALMISGFAAAAEVKQLPVTCVTPQEAEKIVDSTADSVLLAGVSDVFQRPFAVFYNTSTQTYVVLLFTGKNEVCFVDAGKGSAGAPKTQIFLFIFSDPTTYQTSYLKQMGGYLRIIIKQDFWF